MAFTTFPIERVVMQKNSDLPASLQADQILVITPETENMIRPQIGSAGRKDARVDRGVTVVLWSRLNLDVAWQDQSFLLDTTYGLIPFENLVVNSLLTWIPMDSGQNVLAMPTRCQMITPPTSRNADWGSEALSVTYQYYRNVAQATIFPGAQ